MKNLVLKVYQCSRNCFLHAANMCDRFGLRHRNPRVTQAGPSMCTGKTDCQELSCFRFVLTCLYFALILSSADTRRGCVIPRALFPLAARWRRRAGTGLASARWPEQLLPLNALSWSVGLLGNIHAGTCPCRCCFSCVLLYHTCPKW